MIPRGVMWSLLGVVAMAAAVLSFSALRDLAVLCGFSPGLAWMLPLVVDTGAGVGALVWHSGGPTRSFARALTWSLLASSVAGNALIHGLTAYHRTAPWGLVVAVSAVAPAVLGAVVHLTVRAGRPAEAGEPSSETSSILDLGPVELAPGARPDSAAPVDWRAYGVTRSELPDDIDIGEPLSDEVSKSVSELIGVPVLNPGRSTFVYKFLDAADGILYVGITQNLKKRLSDHKRHQEWWSEIASASIEVFPTRSQALGAEYTSIRNDSPKYNKHSGSGVDPLSHRHDEWDRTSQLDVLPLPLPGASDSELLDDIHKRIELSGESVVPSRNQIMDRYSIGATKATRLVSGVRTGPGTGPVVDLSRPMPDQYRTSADQCGPVRAILPGQNWRTTPDHIPTDDQSEATS